MFVQGWHAFYAAIITCTTGPFSPKATRYLRNDWQENIPQR
ncbi:hypothetical protein NBRC3299_0372 [Acetobacter pasteurianus NBRC 3299]|uniref:Uncharacterized protein n=1 Tax=Acetobacter ascendens TaxID=481146 RepID=A0A1Y0V4V0_9PROT|nr:hypothetical protein S101447_00765 [Acetobacter ascendens]GCD74080.1 hypothetical protein NBRC3299_0372 [Acetobacter pasteurianus NBRC 3299]